MTKRTEIAVRILTGLYANAPSAFFYGHSQRCSAPDLPTADQEIVARAFHLADLVLAEEAKCGTDGRPSTEELGKAWNEANERSNREILP